MKQKILATFIAVLVGMGGSVSLAQADAHSHATPAVATSMSKLPRENGIVPATMLPKSDAEWKKVLTPEQYRILRKKKTERAFTGTLYDLEAKGVYRCAACGQPLFDSSTKYDSGTGWPSFYQPVSSAAIATADDSSFFMKRTEVLCSRCGGHLGHVFDDGPQPTGLRYCLNSAALTFEASE